MEKSSETDLLENVCKEAKVEGRLTGAHLSRLFAAFGLRFARAWEALKERRVKKYVFEPSGRVVWIVVGRQRDYIIMSAADFCSCDDFYFRVMDQEIHLCYHLIAQKIAESLKWYALFHEDDKLYDSLIEEWKKVTP